MSDIYHISRFKPGEGGGGVEQFAAYLKRAVPDLTCIGLSDYPQRDAILKDENIYGEYEYAENLNHWLLGSGALNESSTVIVDGYWGLGLQGKVKRLISVCHGTYWGRFVQAQVSSWGEIVGFDNVDAQKDMWESEGVEIVAVSDESAREVHTHCDTKHNICVILNGVDTDILCVQPGAHMGAFMHAATSYRKGLGEIRSLITDHNIGIELMGPCPTLEDKANRLNEALVFVSPTHHEGNAYVLLEAMACDVPVLTYATGISNLLDERCGIVTDDLAPQNLARILRKFQPDQYHPRDWVLENATFEKFAEDWREFLGVH